MKKKFSVAVLFLVVIGLTTVSAKENSWNKMMVSFIEPLREIYSVDLNKKVFSDGEVKKIRDGIGKLKKATHKMRISFVSFFSRKDPAVKAKYDAFLRNLDNAERSLAYSPVKAVYYLKNTVSQCASCHSDGGKSTDFFSLFQKVSLSRQEKGRLALALRDFRASEGFYRELILDEETYSDTFLFNRNLVSYLNSAILNRDNKNKIIQTLKLLKSKAKKKFIAKNLDEKIKDIKLFKPFESTKEAIFKYKQMTDDFNLVDKKMYTFLSIKNYLHANLKKIKSKRTLAEAYMILGDIYNKFVEISVFMVSENNYELCVRTLPKSDLAKNCFEKYERSIVLGYSGSGGIKIPLFEKEKIQSLKKMLSKK